MKIQGLSYQKGIFFIGKSHVACGYHEKGQLKSWVKPLSIKTILVMMKQVMFAMPIWYKLLAVLVVSLVVVPDMFESRWSGLPYYTIIYFMLGTHFIFPNQLRKYHGA